MSPRVRLRVRRTEPGWWTYTVRQDVVGIVAVGSFPSWRETLRRGLRSLRVCADFPLEVAR